MLTNTGLKRSAKMMIKITDKKNGRPFVALVFLQLVCLFIAQAPPESYTRDPKGPPLSHVNSADRATGRRVVARHHPSGASSLRIQARRDSLICPRETSLPVGRKRRRGAERVAAEGAP